MLYIASRCRRLFAHCVAIAFLFGAWGAVCGEDAVTVPPTTTSALAEGLRVTVALPKGYTAEEVIIALNDGGRTVEVQHAKAGTAQFAAVGQEGMVLNCRVVMGGVACKVRHVLTPGEVQAKAVQWALPLERAGQKTTFHVTNRATGADVAGALVVLRRKSTGRAVTSGTTDIGGRIAFGIDLEEPVVIACERIPTGSVPGGWMEIADPTKVPITEEHVKAGVVELPIDIPSVSVRVTVEQKTKTGTVKLTSDDGYVLCLPVERPKRGPSTFLGNVVADAATFVGLPPGKYRFKMIAGTEPDKYVTVAPNDVLIKDGEVQNITLTVQLANEYRGRVEGVVRGPKGALGDITVRVRRNKGGYSAVVKTDKSGAFAFAEVPGSQYLITAEGPGYEKLSETIDVPCTLLQLEMQPVVQVIVRIAEGAGARCAIFYQDKLGHLREGLGISDGEGKALLSIAQTGPCIVWAFTADGSRAAGRLLQIDGDTEAGLTLQATREVTLHVTGEIPGRRLMFVSTDKPVLVPCMLDGKEATVKLLAGTYDVLLQKGRDGYVVIAGNWSVPEQGNEATIEVPVKPGQAKSLDEIFIAILRRHGASTRKLNVDEVTAHPATANQSIESPTQPSTESQPGE